MTVRWRARPLCAHPGLRPRARRSALTTALVLALALALSLPGGAARAGEVRRGLDFDSAALGRALAYSLYLPDGWSTDGPPVPAIYLLHGHGGGENDYLNAAALEATADRLIADGTLPPVLIVLPDGGNSWYVDARDAAGAVASALRDDLPSHVEARWNARTDRGGRAVAGLSMGGFGALRLAFFHPDRYAAVAAMSPAVFVPGTFDAPPNPMQVGMFAGAFGTPFDEARLERESPFAALDALAGHPAPPPVFLTVGDDDGFGLEIGTMALAIALKARGLPVEIRVLDGDHTWPFWREQLPEVLRFLGRRLTR